MKKRKTLIWMLSLVCLLVVGIGFAAIATINLKVDGSVELQPNENAYSVIFSAGSLTDGGDAEKDTISVSGNTADIDVTSLNTKGSSVTFTLTIKNASSDDIDAVVSKPSVSKETDTANAFTVTTAVADATWTGDTKVLAQNGTTTITVTVTLDIAPINAVTGSFEVTFTAAPQLAA